MRGYNGCRRAARALYHDYVATPTANGLRNPRTSAPPLRTRSAAMSRPLYAQINLAALRANLARVREKAPGTQVLAVVKANAYGHGLHARAPGARGCRRPRAGRAGRRVSTCASGATRGGSCCSRASSRSRSCPSSRSAAWRQLCTTWSRCACSRRPCCRGRSKCSSRSTSGMNRLGFRPGDVAGVCQRLVLVAVGRGAAAHDALRARGRGRRPQGAARRSSRPPARALRIRARSPIPPASSAFAEVGGDIVRPGIMLYGATPFPYDTADMLGLHAGDDAALAAHRRAGPQGQRKRRLRRGVHRVARRIASASSPAAMPTAIRGTRRTARRCSCAAGRCGSRAGRRWTCSRST